MFELDKGAIAWNLGDTSFRRKALVHDYKILLMELFKLKLANGDDWNSEVQSEYYASVKSNSNIMISSKITDLDRMAKLGRTFTNGLHKLGFCDKERNLTTIGLQFLNIEKIVVDEFEKRLQLKRDNIIFLRQLLKMYIWDNDVNIGFNPFIFLIRLLNKYDYLNKDEFEVIVQISSGKIDFEKVLKEFSKVRNNTITLEEFLNENMMTQRCSDEVKNFVEEEILNEKVFYEVFYNRKTSSSKKKYLEFYKQLIIYKNDKNNQSELDKLIILLKDNIIKKAFKTNKIFTKLQGKITCSDFINRYHDVKLITLDNNEEFRQEFVDLFIKAKREDLIREYRDMTYRIFNITGILNTKNNVVKIDNLYAKEYFKVIDNSLSITINSKSKDKSNEVFSTLQILNSNKIDEIDEKLRKEYKINRDTDIIKYLNKKEVEEFHEFIKNKFNKDKVIELLKLIRDRKDKKIYNEVTDQTTIPTIFEYVLGIAWLYISEFEFDLLNSLNLTLDSNYYPLSHAVGGAGDIVINYDSPKKHKLMLEVTLMDINTQKRGELEPVIRHSVNLRINAKKENIDTYNIFIANELDNNVVNIFRTCNLLDLESSLNKGEFTTGTKIVSFKIDEIINILKKNIKYTVIFNSMKKEFMNDKLENINNKWREKFINSISQR